MVPLQLVGAFAQRNLLGGRGFLDIVNHPATAQASVDNRSTAQTVVALVTSAILLLVTPFVAGAISRVVAASYLGREETPGSALRATGRRWWALLAAWFLVHVLEAVFFVLCILPGLLVMAMFVAVAPAIVTEELGPIAGMRRSWRLVRRRVFPVLGIALISGLLASVLGNVLGGIPTAIALAIGLKWAWPLLRAGVHHLRPGDDAVRGHRGDAHLLRRTHPSGGIRPAGHGRGSGAAAIAVVMYVALALADLPRPTRDPHRVVDTVHRVLARPEFQRPGPSLLERVQRDVLDWIARVLDGLVRAGLAGWILALMVVLVALVVWRVLRDVTRDPGRAFEVSLAPSRSPADWRAEAEQHERAGEWRQALRCRYRALVVDLAGRGLLEEVPGRTAGEYRAELGHTLPAAGASFRGATELFEGAWYGRRPTAAADTSRFRQLADDVLETAR